ncbi:MAG: flagellar hook-length control protein FliK [Methylotenera sp.]|uniref:flagellar hook-length control protein FliK n=1 Tax=Methylotenera sp. TaxID=2051956 RepID=UPI0024897FF7|nr:flagellar hook-length control protein FliK [Methylotenera sp.]MDI1308510.1 flagellar hook-length control protein FliK [Methylotenera sp.]
MKNLSLQMTETSLKKPLDAVNKNTPVSSASNTENNASFQMMLNKQVQAKHASAREIESKQNQTKQTQKNAQNGSALPQVKTATNHTKAIKDAEKVDPMQLASKEIMALDTKSALLKGGDESQVENDGAILKDVNLSDKTPITDISGLQMFSSMMSEVKQTALAKTAVAGNGSEMTADKQLSLGAEKGSILKDSVLSNALSQGKNSADAKDLAVIDDKQSGREWIDTVLPNAKSANGDDAAKLMLKAEKDSLNKEMAMPANYQTTSLPSIQAKAAEAMQQLGSSNTLNVYPGKAGWDQAISQKVVWMLGAQEQSATLTLNPPDLGPLQIVIRVHNDQADTTFISDNAEVRQALQDGMDNLRGKMNESGIQLGQANVNSGGQMQQQFQQAAQQSRAEASVKDSTISSTEQVNSSNKTLVHTSNGLVDTFV